MAFPGSLTFKFCGKSVLGGRYHKKLFASSVPEAEGFRKWEQPVIYLNDRSDNQQRTYATLKSSPTLM
jgi:hypothetical protein